MRIGDFTVSVSTKESVRHFKILRAAGGWFFVNIIYHTSLNKLVVYHKRNTVARGGNLILGDPLPVAEVRYQFEAQYPDEVTA